MVRVWGGGIYESDTFYDTCDGEISLLWRGTLLTSEFSRAWR